MRKSGFPFQKNPPILNLPQTNLTDFNLPPADPNIIDLSERFRDSIIFRTDESRTGAILGEFVSVGDHLRILIQGPGRLNIGGDPFENIKSKETFGIILSTCPKAVKVFRQDGSIEIFLRNDTRVQAAFFSYAVGNPVWYDVHGPEADIRTGILTDISRKVGTEDIETFTIKDDETGAITVQDFRNVIIRMALPAQKPDFDSNYNAVLVIGIKPGLKL